MTAAAPRRLGRTEVRELLEVGGIRPTSSLGQNFVVDPNTVDAVARLAEIGPGDRVLEIGAGLGSLTLALASTGAAVTAVEIDERLVELLRTIVPPSVRLVAADALRVDWGELLGRAAAEGDDGDGDGEGGSGGRSGGAGVAGSGAGVAGSGGGAPGWVLVANLPYNIAATLVIDLLEHVPAVRRMLVMVQREVGERLAASPGGKEFGAVSVRVAYFAAPRLAGRVSPEVFHPRPKVDSALVALDRLAAPAVDPALATYAEIVALVRAGFSGRRKMLRRSLAGLVGEEAFALASIAPTARAEELGVLEWGRLAASQRAIEAGTGAHPSRLGRGSRGREAR